MREKTIFLGAVKSVCDTFAGMLVPVDRDSAIIVIDRMIMDFAGRYDYYELTDNVLGVNYDALWIEARKIIDAAGLHEYHWFSKNDKRCQSFAYF